MASVDEECPDYPWPNLRLPSDLQPIEYTLLIKPNLINFTSWGNVDIDLEVLKETNLIVVNAKDLNIRSFRVLINQSESGQMQMFNCSFIDQLAFKLNNKVERGDQLRLAIEFEGKIRDDMAGLYRNTHIGPDGNKRLGNLSSLSPGRLCRLLSKLCRRHSIRTVGSSENVPLSR